MLVRKLLLVLVTYISLAIPTQVSAWDGQRKGFIFGVGGGVAITRVATVTGHGTEHESSFGMNTGGRFGYGTNMFQIYFCYHVSIFDVYSDTIDVSPVRVKDVTVGQLDLGFGASYYLEDVVPSIFIEGGLGILGFHDPISRKGKNGGAIFLALGYEFARHWNVKLDYIIGGSSSSEDYSRSDISTLAFTVNVLGY